MLAPIILINSSVSARSGTTSDARGSTSGARLTSRSALRDSLSSLRNYVQLVNKVSRGLGRLRLAVIEQR